MQHAIVDGEHWRQTTFHKDICFLWEWLVHWSTVTVRHMLWCISIATTHCFDMHNCETTVCFQFWCKFGAHSTRLHQCDVSDVPSAHAKWSIPRNFQGFFNLICLVCQARTQNVAFKKLPCCFHWAHKHPTCNCMKRNGLMLLPFLKSVRPFVKDFPSSDDITTETQETFMLHHWAH